MKRAVLVVLAIVFVLGLLTQGLAAQYRSYPNSRRGDMRTEISRRPQPRRGISDANSLIKDLPFLKDPNVVTANVNKFEGLQARIDGVCKQGGREFSKWTRVPIDDPASLATEVQRQIIAEMVMVRELAAEEGAAKTVAAIDSLLIDRQQRLDKIIKRMGAKERRTRGDEQDFQRGRAGYRDPRGRRGAYYGRERAYGESTRYDRRGRYPDDETETTPRRRVPDATEDDEPAENEDPNQ